MIASSCTFHQHLDAFYDGALDVTTRDLVDKHLTTCAECRNYLDSLGRMSRWLDEAADGKLSGIELARIHAAVDAEMDAADRRTVRPSFGAERGFSRVAILVSALAASVLIIGSVWLWEIPPSSRPAPGPSNVAVSMEPWEKVAMTLQVDPIPGEEIRTARASDLPDWMLDQVIGRAVSRSRD